LPALRLPVSIIKLIATPSGMELGYNKQIKPSATKAMEESNTALPQDIYSESHVN
jgi:hypothetical protein